MTPDSKTLVTIAGGATVYVWSLSGVHPPYVLPLSRAPRRIAISPDSRRAAVVGGDSIARVYDLVGGRLLASLQHNSRVLSAAFGSQGERLVTGTSNHLAHIWNLSTLNEVYTLKGHEGPVADVAVSPNGQFIATASADGTAIVWSRTTRPRPGLLIATPTLLGHTNAVNGVVFSPTGSMSPPRAAMAPRASDPLITAISRPFSQDTEPGSRHGLQPVGCELAHVCGGRHSSDLGRRNDTGVARARKEAPPSRGDARRHAHPRRNCEPRRDSPDLEVADTRFNPASP